MVTMPEVDPILIRRTIVLVGPCQRVYWPVWLHQRECSARNLVAVASADLEDILGCAFDTSCYFDPAYLADKRDEYAMITRLRVLLQQSDVVCIVAVDGRPQDAQVVARVAQFARLGSVPSVLIRIENFEKTAPRLLRQMGSDGTVDALLPIQNRENLSSGPQLEQPSPTGRRLHEFIAFLDGFLYGRSQTAVGFDDIRAALAMGGEIRFSTITSTPPERIDRCLSTLQSKLGGGRSAAANTVLVGIEAAPCGLQASETKDIMRRIRAWSQVDPDATVICNTGYDPALKLSQLRVSAALLQLRENKKS